MIGRAIFRGLEMLCPVTTNSALAIAEQPELRAYKLGKQKCSYNQVELVIKDVAAGKASDLRVSEAIETCVGSEVDEQLRESCLKFNVRFVNNNRMHLYIYVVYATPYGTVKTGEHTVMYHWIPVTRCKCRKGCKGAVIRGLQRFGRMPRRSAATLDGEDSWKEPRHLYIAIDEASTHVCPRHETSKFRLLVAAYDDTNQLLGTTVSSSIRVLANNDAPLGAAAFKLHCNIKGNWDLGGLADSPLQNIHNWPIGEPQFSHAPLRDVIPNFSPPRSCKSTTTEETAKHMDDVSPAAVPLLELDPNQMLKGKEFQNEGLSSSKLRVGGPHETLVFQKLEKQHSLTDLCQRLFKACVAKQELGQATISLRSLANCLGVRRRQILEILNVLETIQVVQHKTKEHYTWIGIGLIARAVVKLKGSMPAAIVREHVDASHGQSFLQPVRKAKFKADLSRQIDDMRTEANNNPMRALSKRFVQQFLLHQSSSVRWEQILECIVDGQGHDPETARATNRRLGEIARIFCALHLIKKVANQKLQSGIVYEWLGTQSVADYLTNINLSGVDGKSRWTQQAGLLRVESPAKEENIPVRRPCSQEHGRRPDACTTKLEQKWKSDTTLPTTRSKFLNDGVRSSADRKIKRKASESDENAPVVETSLTSEQKRSHRFRGVSGNQFSKRGSRTNDYMSSCRESALSAAYRLCQSRLARHIRGEIPSQLGASVSHQLSQLIPCQASSLIPCREEGLNIGPREVDQRQSSETKEAGQKDKDLTCHSALELARDPCDLETVESPTVSSERVDRGFLSLCGLTDEDSITTEALEDSVICQQNRPGAKERLPNIVDDLRESQESISDNRELSKSKSLFHCSQVVASEQDYNTCQSRPLKEFVNKKESAAHHFPLKKRKIGVTSSMSFADFQESCDPGRNSDTSTRDSHDGVLGQDQQYYRPSTFDPFFHLLCFNSPKQILQFQSQNPAFFFTYVKESRAQYHKYNSQTAVPPLIRPVAKVGKALAVKEDFPE